jgi:hypothetical protein
MTLLLGFLLKGRIVRDIRFRKIDLSFGLLLALSTSGCATALSSFSPAHVPQKGSFHAEAGLDVSVPTGAISNTIDAAKEASSVASKTGQLSSDEKFKVFDAGVNLLLNPPAVLQHAGLAYSPLHRTEVSLRFVGAGWRLGGRYQLLEQGVNSSWDLSMGFGATRQTFSFPVDNVIDILKIDDFKRYTIDLPVAFGRRGSWYRIWGGPRLLFTTGHTQMTLTIPNSNEIEVATADSSGFFYGTQTGFALGYKNVFLGFELNLVKFKGTAELMAPGARRNVNLDTFVVYPGIALMGEF